MFWTCGSLIANAFTANKPLKVAHVARAPNTPKADKPVWIRPIDGISKLHDVIFFVMRTLRSGRTVLPKRQTIFFTLLRIMIHAGSLFI